MKTTDFIQQFGSLSYHEQAELLNQLKGTLSASKPIAAHRKTRDKQCQHCGSYKVYKHGKTTIDAQRYRCFDCGTCYNMLTGTAINFVKKKDLLDRFIGLMLESKSVRYTAKELGIDPSTAFDWRHKILSSFNDLFQKKFGKEVEIDPLQFRLNQKGRRRGLIKTNKTKKGKVKDKATVLFMMDSFFSHWPLLQDHRNTLDLHPLFKSQVHGAHPSEPFSQINFTVLLKSLYRVTKTVL